MAAGVANGLPVISIMGIVQAGDAGLVIPANSGWNTLKDVKGKRILVASGSGTAPYLDAFLKAGGVSREDFTIINVDLTAQAPTYISGGAMARCNSPSTSCHWSVKIARRKSFCFPMSGCMSRAMA